MRISTLILISASIGLVFTGQQALKAQTKKPAEQAIRADVEKDTITQAFRNYIAENVYPQNDAVLYPALAQTCDVNFAADAMSGTIICEGINGSFQSAETAKQATLPTSFKIGNANIYYKLSIKKSF